MKVYVSVPVNDDDFDYKFIADHSDGVIAMNYDQHFSTSAPGPIASQSWFVKNLRDLKKVVPPQKLICAIASYGYDWSIPKTGQRPEARNVTVQEAWIEASDSESDIDFHSDSLNPHFAFRGSAQTETRTQGQGDFRTQPEVLDRVEVCLHIQPEEL